MCTKCNFASAISSFKRWPTCTMSFGESYEKYSRLFQQAETIRINDIYNHLGLIVTVLGIIAVFSTSFALLINLKNQNHLAFFINSIVASITIGLLAVMLANYVGVYI